MGQLRRRSLEGGNQIVSPCAESRRGRCRTHLEVDTVIRFCALDLSDQQAVVVAQHVDLHRTAIFIVDGQLRNQAIGLRGSHRNHESLQSLDFDRRRLQGEIVNITFWVDRSRDVITNELVGQRRDRERFGPEQLIVPRAVVRITLLFASFPRSISRFVFDAKSVEGLQVGNILSRRREILGNAMDAHRRVGLGRVSQSKHVSRFMQGHRIELIHAAKIDFGVENNVPRPGSGNDRVVRDGEGDRTAWHGHRCHANISESRISLRGAERAERIPRIGHDAHLTADRLHPRVECSDDGRLPLARFSQRCHLCIEGVRLAGNVGSVPRKTDRQLGGIRPKGRTAVQRQSGLERFQPQWPPRLHASSPFPTVSGKASRGFPTALPN